MLRKCHGLDQNEIIFRNYLVDTYIMILTAALL